MHIASDRLIEKTVYLLPTNACNLKCPECCTQLARNSKENELTLEDYKQIVQKCTSLGYFKYDISGGEPFLREDLIELLQLIKKDSRNKTVMVSNGTVKRFSELELQQILSLTDELHISIDSPNADTHDILRGKVGAFENTVELINILNRIRKQSNEIHCKIGINFIWKNVDEASLIGMYRLTDELDLDFLEVLKYININGTISKEIYCKVFEAIDNLVFLQEELQRKVNINLPSLLYPEFLSWRKKHLHEQLKNIVFRYDALGGCARHLNNIVIGPSGEMTTCVSMLNFKQLTFENWKNCSFPMYMINSVKEKIHKREMFLLENEKCGSCDRYIYCRGGCPVESLAHDDGLNSLPANCLYKRV